MLSQGVLFPDNLYDPRIATRELMGPDSSQRPTALHFYLLFTYSRSEKSWNRGLVVTRYTFGYASVVYRLVCTRAGNY